MSEAIDLLIEARWLIPIEPAGVTLEHHAVAVDAGRIVAVLPAPQARQRYGARRTVMLDSHVLLPGLVNLHTHAAMTLLRGYADDMELMAWLKERIWPAEMRLASTAFVRDGTLLAAAEMLRGGITCCNDMYFFPEAAAQAFLRLGMRAALGIIVVDFPSPYGADADDYLRKGIAMRDALRGEPLLSFCIAPHAPYTVSDKTLQRIATMAQQLDVPLHIHVHETQDEIDKEQAQHGVRPLERLRRIGLLGPNLIAVHAVHLTEQEIDLLAEHACSIAHCPTSNMKLASGIAPAAQAMGAGINIGLGTDGAASNNRLDLFREMRHAALLAKVATGDPRALDAHHVLRMATLNGAAALALDREIGSIEPGKAADLCAVDFSAVELSPCFNPASHLVYAAGREHVSHVWLQGELRVAQGQLLQISNTELLDIARVWQNKLRI
jgi:5-methylthioadenosine/S-adenosylhomocysteine deaminase